MAASFASNAAVALAAATSPARTAPLGGAFKPDVGYASLPVHKLSLQPVGNRAEPRVIFNKNDWLCLCSTPSARGTLKEAAAAEGHKR